MEVALKNWFQNKAFKDFKDFPFVVMWGILVSINENLFHDRYIPSYQCSSYIRVVFGNYKICPKPLKARIIKQPQMYKSMSRGFFDGLSQYKASTYGVGGFLYITNDHFFVFEVGMGRGSNNYAKLFTLKVLLKFVVDKGIPKT
jgi:hypothetical protein